MRKLFKKLWNDERGNALIIFGASLPMIMGAAGLASDTIQWTLWKRELQRAADSAAFAGVYAQAQENASMTAAQAVANDLTKNNTTKIALLSGYPQIAYPTGTGYNDAVRVTLAIQQQLGFSSLFMSTPPTITTSATAALVLGDKYCVVALAPDGEALKIGGNANVDMGCGAISNSSDPIDAVDIAGNSHWFKADPVAAAGGIEGTINGSPSLEPYALKMEDPYASLPTAIPPGETCTNFNHPSKVYPNGKMKPGCYNSFNLGGGTVTLSPGTYYLNSTSIQLTGHERLVGDGVTIILTGNSPGSISMTGNSSMDLTAPTTGTYANMLLIQAPNAAVGNDNTINGNNGTVLDGAIYFPKGDLDYSGSSAQAFQCAMIVGYTVTFTGSTDIQNDQDGDGDPDTDDCDANTQVQHKKIRLIA
ncbi:MAG TPA: TadE/TadG family type IV pilus assembly protein [Sphingomicrobium sp.]|nr:TadE/TadG family type IV pilus assembly protein [Sphingomicrobium sp.]